jgi:hypothetical protein
MICKDTMSCVSMLRNKCNISVKIFSKCFKCILNEPYFSPYFSEQNNLSSQEITTNQPYYLINKSFFDNKVIRFLCFCNISIMLPIQIFFINRRGHREHREIRFCNFRFCEIIYPFDSVCGEYTTHGYIGNTPFGSMIIKELLIKKSRKKINYFTDIPITL